MASKKDQLKRENEKIKNSIFIGEMVVIILLSLLTLCRQGALGKGLFKWIYYLFGSIGAYLWIVIVIGICGLFIWYGKKKVRLRDSFSLFLLFSCFLVLLSISNPTNEEGQIIVYRGGQIGSGAYSFFSKLGGTIGAVIFVLILGGVSIAILFNDYFNNFIDRDKDVNVKKVSKFSKEVIQQDLENKLKGKDDRYPPMTLLNRYEKQKNESTTYMENCGKKIKHILFENGYNSKIVNMVSGPSTIRYTISLNGSTKMLSSIHKLLPLFETDLGTNKIRIEAPIEGKSRIAIEIPNETRKKIAIRSLLSAQKGHDPLDIPLGVNQSNQNVYLNLDQTPHVLITGREDSGKTSYLHNMIISMLMNSTPDELQMVLIDPQALDFINYEHLPHLFDNVVNDVHQSLFALENVVSEMERRYSLFAKAKVKDILEYEKKEILPYIIVIITEYVELSYDQSFEKLIIQLTEHGANAGIHVVIASKHCSPTVITNRIRMAIPTHISFALNDPDESDLIFASAGAEKLLGKGDLLYKKNGKSNLERVQASYVTQQEINAVVDYILDHYSTEEIYEKCKAYIKKHPDDFSIIDLQRELSVPYSMLVQTMDRLESEGYISSETSTRPRKVNE